MTRLLAVFCSLLMVTAISGADIAIGEVTSQPSASQNQAQPSGAMQPSQMGTTGAGPAQTNQGVIQVTPGTQMQSAPDMMQQQDTTGAMMGAGPGGMQMCPMGSVAVDSDSIYVLRGNQLLRYNKDNMRLMTTTMLPSPAQTQALATPAAPGQGPVICPSGTQEVATCPPSVTGAGPATVTLRTDLTPRPAFQQMLQSMQQLAPCDYDRAYLQAMIQAQCGVVEWSNLANSRANHADLRRFAERVADDESQLSIKYSTWLHEWYGISSRTCERATPMDADTLACLQNVSGRDFEIAYMQALITYFSEAIQLSCNAQEKAARPELKTTASALATKYTNNIQQLRSWAASWYGVSI